MSDRSIRPGCNGRPQSTCRVDPRCPARARRRSLGEARPRPRVERRSEHAGRPTRLGAASVRLPLLLSDDSARQEPARTRCRPERVLRERVREHVRALRCGGHQARPRSDARVAGGRCEPGRRRVRLSLDRGGEPGLSADPARARCADGRHERTRPRPRRRAPGARPAAARARRRPERGLLRRARRPAWSRAGDDRATGLARRRRQPARR